MSREQGTVGRGGVAPAVDRRLLLRRAFGGVLKVGAALGVLEGIHALRGSGASTVGARGTLGMVRPPGALEEAQFLARCMRCTRCADACAPQCIRLFGADAGVLQGSPYIVPGERGCTMCLACGPACPTGAIEVLERMQDADMGVAVVDERLCVSHNGTGVCGACHTACPLRNRAITQNFRNAPEVHNDECTGCGLCEEVCIVRDRRAIRVVTKRTTGTEALT
jgi:MauM/NapG family ferredoxin protein